MTTWRALSAEARQLVETFRRELVSHPILDQTTNDVRTYLSLPVARPIATLVGPAGAGKSTLVTRVIRDIAMRRAAEFTEFPERIPVLTTSVPSGRRVTMKSFYTTLLTQLDAPLPGRKIDPARRRELLRHKMHSPTEADLRAALLAEIARTQPAALIFDEADHFTRGRATPELASLADVFKDLANQTQLPILLVGTYVLLGFGDLTAQFARRERVIYLRPYDYAKPAERNQFRTAVYQLASRLPVPQPELADDIEMIYERTLGCVGNVKEWFLLALTEALAEGTDRVTEQHLMRTRQPLDRLDNARVEIKNGTVRLAETRGALANYRRELGLPPSKLTRPPARSAPTKPIKRRPRRDTVGAS